MTTKPSAAAARAAVVAPLLLLLVAAAATMTTTTEAATSPCNPALLTPCAGPALFGGAVPPACCAQLRAQQGCLCGYARSPNYGSYIRSPNAAKLFAVCSVATPRCG
ncbi:probable non-specific lipid-transfer protein 2 [Miscanthus floridulus]|uniref:probable non-specific lipid-transfer protein 2 n=1 Tax=Miscanthus floridulus TaxID=154761 RepID=UPI00345AE516